MKGSAIATSIALAASVGAAHASDLYGEAVPMDAAALDEATGMVAVATSVAAAANANETLQVNAQGVGIGGDVLGIGACSKCDASNSNNTSQSATASSSATANSPNFASQNINIGEASGVQNGVNGGDNSM